MAGTEPLKSAVGLIARVVAGVVATTAAVMLGAIYILVASFSEARQATLTVVSAMCIGIFMVLLGGALLVVESGVEAADRDDATTRPRASGARAALVAGVLLIVASVGFTHWP